MENIYTNELRKLIEEIPNTSAWKKGVTVMEVVHLYMMAI